MREKGRLAVWLENKYLDWQRQNGRATIKEFAALFGLSGPYVSQLMDGIRPHMSMQTALKIAETLGDYEILDILGYARPDPGSLLVGVPAEFRESVLAALSEINEAVVKSGSLVMTPETERMIREAFARHGIKFDMDKWTA